MSGLDADRLDPRPVLLEILAEQLLLLVIEVGEKQREEIAGAILEYVVMRRIERRDHRFEQMHVRILPPRHRRRQALEEAAVRRAQLGIQEITERVDLAADLRIAVQRVDGGERQQHKGVVISVAQWLQHGAFRRQDMDEAGLAVGAFGFGQKVIQPLQRHLAALRIPAHPGGLGETIDLPGLHHNPPRRLSVGTAVGGEPVDEAARRPVPTFAGPQRQRMVDHAGLQPCNDVGRIFCRSGFVFSHCVPRDVSNTGSRRLIARHRRQAIGPNSRDLP